MEKDGLALYEQGFRAYRPVQSNVKAKLWHIIVYRGAQNE
jgi:hypothetical protein